MKRRNSEGDIIVECCGQEITCTHFTNTCSRCGADYNFAGQWLAPRSQWGEETGETAEEILRDTTWQVK